MSPPSGRLRPYDERDQRGSTPRLTHDHGGGRVAPGNRLGAHAVRPKTCCCGTQRRRSAPMGRPSSSAGRSRSSRQDPERRTHHMTTIETNDVEAVAVAKPETIIEQIIRARPAIIEEREPVGMGWLRDLPDFRDFTEEYEKIRPQLEEVGVTNPEEVSLPVQID